MAFEDKIINRVDWQPSDGDAIKGLDWHRLAGSLESWLNAPETWDPPLSTAARSRILRHLAAHVAELGEPCSFTELSDRLEDLLRACEREQLPLNMLLTVYRRIETEAQRMALTSVLEPSELAVVLHALSKRLMADIMVIVSHYYDLQTVRAETDALTGAATRWGFHSWKRRHPAMRGLVLAFDLDDFKWFNDTFGHRAGDSILQQFTARLEEACRAGDLLVRAGGDEFFLWMSGVDQVEGAQLAARIHRTVTAMPYQVGSEPYHLGVSLGWATGRMEEALAQRADAYLLTAKRRGKNRVVGPISAQAGDETPPELEPGTGSSAFRPTAELGWLAQAADALWDTWSTPAVMVNREGKIVALNHAYEETVGRSREQLLGKNPSVNQSGHTPRAVYRRLWNTLHQGGNWRGLLENRRPDGSYWWAEEHLAPIRVGNHVVGYSGTLHNLDRERGQAPLSATLIDGTRWSFAFQPVASLTSGIPIGYEPIVTPIRSGQPVPADAFFDLVRRLKDKRVDRAVIRALSRTLGACPPLPAEQFLFIPLRTAAHATLSDFTRMVARLTAEVAPDRLVFETDASDGEIAFMKPLQERFGGIQWAMAGIGRKNVGLCPAGLEGIQWVKLDRELTGPLFSDLAQSPQPLVTLVAALISWARRRHIHVIADGIDSKAHAEIALTLGATHSQGHWLGAPRPAGQNPWGVWGND